MDKHLSAPEHQPVKSFTFIEVTLQKSQVSRVQLIFERKKIILTPLILFQTQCYKFNPQRTSPHLRFMPPDYRLGLQFLGCTALLHTSPSCPQLLCITTHHRHMTHELQSTALSVFPVVCEVILSLCVYLGFDCFGYLDIDLGCSLFMLFVDCLTPFLFYNHRFAYCFSL